MADSKKETIDISKYITGPDGKELPFVTDALAAQTKRTRVTLRELLWVFYNRYSAKNLEKLDQMVGTFSGREATAFKAMEERYGCAAGTVVEVEKDILRVKMIELAKVNKVRLGSLIKGREADINRDLLSSLFQGLRDKQDAVFGCLCTIYKLEEDAKQVAELNKVDLFKTLADRDSEAFGKICIFKDVENVKEFLSKNECPIKWSDNTGPVPEQHAGQGQQHSPPPPQTVQVHNTSASPPPASGTHRSSSPSQQHHHTSSSKSGSKHNNNMPEYQKNSLFNVPEPTVDVLKLCREIVATKKTQMKKDGKDEKKEPLNPHELSRILLETEDEVARRNMSVWGLLALFELLGREHEEKEALHAKVMRANMDKGQHLVELEKELDATHAEINRLKTENGRLKLARGAETESANPPVLNTVFSGPLYVPPCRDCIQLRCKQLKFIETDRMEATNGKSGVYSQKDITGVDTANLLRVKCPRCARDEANESGGGVLSHPPPRSVLQSFGGGGAGSSLLDQHSPIPAGTPPLYLQRSADLHHQLGQQAYGQMQQQYPAPSHHPSFHQQAGGGAAGGVSPSPYRPHPAFHMNPSPGAGGANLSDSEVLARAMKLKAENDALEAELMGLQ